MKSLEKILWEELGSKTDYEKEYGDTPIGRLVRRIITTLFKDDMGTAKRIMDVVADIKRNSEEIA